ncbi:MAG: hypothetical protein LBT97_08380 [Planctomycetota bacterium]|nr:hypothetical protein [Planctomycetota bacterium]
MVGIGAGLGYASLGPTHHALEDIAWLRSITNMTVLRPCRRSGKNPLFNREPGFYWHDVVRCGIFRRFTFGGEKDFVDGGWECRVSKKGGQVVDEMAAAGFGNPAGLAFHGFFQVNVIGRKEAGRAKPVFVQP